jgi:cobalt/nickel transport system permease protein
VKLIFTLAALVVIVTSGGVFLPVVMSLFTFIILSTISIPLRLVVFRMLAPLWVAAVVMAVRLFLDKGEPLFELQVLFWNLTGYREGLEQGTLLASKVLGGGSMLLFLSMTTPVNRIFASIRYFKVPAAWVEVAMFTYRYIFVFIDDLINLKDAQRVRLGYIGWRRGMNSFGILAGSVLVRAFDQAESTSQAMKLRGYNGEFLQLVLWDFRLKDFMAATALTGMLVGLKTTAYLIG